MSSTKILHFLSFVETFFLTLRLTFSRIITKLKEKEEPRTNPKTDVQEVTKIKIVACRG